MVNVYFALSYQSPIYLFTLSHFFLSYMNLFFFIEVYASYMMTLASVELEKQHNFSKCNVYPELNK